MTTETFSKGNPKKKPSIAERMDAQNRLIAEKLHKLGYIYALYGALDGLSVSYSLFKYFFDLAANNSKSSSDVMHDWMTTPEGALTAAGSSIAIIAFSLFANHFNDNDPNAFKRYVAIVWPYLRDSTKGLKNAYKGVRSSLQVIELLGGGIEVRNLILPVGLLLGGLSIVNRMFYRYVRDKRKGMMQKNGDLLKEIQSIALNMKEVGDRDKDIQNFDKIVEDYRSIVQKQSMFAQGAGLLSQAYSGIVDGLYLYVGILSVSTLAPPVLIAMSVFCTLYVCMCIATRMYEEYDFQVQLCISQTKIEIALSAKKIELLFNHLNALALELANAPENEVLKKKQDELNEKLTKEIAHFESQREKLRTDSTLTYTSAFLAGMKNGLAAYGALTGAMFALATIFTLTSTAFPPGLVVTCIVVGAVVTLGFIAHSLATAYQNQKKVASEKKNLSKETRLVDLVERIKNNKQLQAEPKKENIIEPGTIKDNLAKNMKISSSPEFSSPQWFEVLRSLFSGVSKGSKAIDYTFNLSQHDSPVIFVLTAVSSVIHSIALALRAYARGFGRKSLAVPLVPPDEPKELEPDDARITSASLKEEPLAGMESSSQAFTFPIAQCNENEKLYRRSFNNSLSSSRPHYSFAFFPSVESIYPPLPNADADLQEIDNDLNELIKKYPIPSTAENANELSLQ